MSVMPGMSRRLPAGEAAEDRPDRQPEPAQVALAEDLASHYRAAAKPVGHAY